MATQQLDQYDYVGYRASDTQALKWPRDLAPVPDSYGLTYYESDEIPIEIKNAQYEWALYIMGGDVTAQSPLGNFNRIKVDDIELEMNQPVQSGTIPAEVAQLLKDLRVNASGAAIVRA